MTITQDGDLSGTPDPAVCAVCGRCPSAVAHVLGAGRGAHAFVPPAPAGACVAEEGEQ